MTAINSWVEASVPFWFKTTCSSNHRSVRHIRNGQVQHTDFINQ